MSNDQTNNQEKPLVTPQPVRDGNKVFQKDMPGGFGAPVPPAMAKSALWQEIPFESVPLPSKGIIYSEDSGISGKETIDIKAMGPVEEDILTSPAYIKKGTVIAELLKSCIVDKGIDPENMIAGDRNAIMTAIRAVGYGADYGPIQVDCSACQYRDDKHVFMLNQLKIKPLTIAPVRPHTNLFEFKLPISGFTVLYKYLTGKEEEELNKLKEARKRKLGQVHDNNVTDQLFASIVEVEGISDKAEISQFIHRSMRAKDSKSLRKHMDDHEPGIIMRQDHECPACNIVEEVSIPIGVTFFWPE